MRVTHHKYKKLELNRRKQWEEVKIVLLTEEEAEVLNLDSKRVGVKYELAAKPKSAKK